MLSGLLIDIVVLTILVLGLTAAGVWFGYYLKDMSLKLSGIRSRLKDLEEDFIAEPAIIDAKSPKQVHEEQFESKDEDSAIIVAKKPAELRREKDRKLDEELDKLGR